MNEFELTLFKKIYVWKNNCLELAMASVLTEAID